MELTKEKVESKDLNKAMGLTEERSQEMMNEMADKAETFNNKSDMLRGLIEVSKNPEELAFMAYCIGSDMACESCPERK